MINESFVSLKQILYNLFIVLFNKIVNCTEIMN